ncbi:unknown protein [Desulfotalea psychrophila LSv54]|uniref:Uncharacterized protein n=1 Tax=Desulfotalea psychrophila (strain LSv54 / DSM 12343) TaxID=177439 RepID=Q6AIE7_DESPS|nr:unknown protein [Desulfotalea psychrophila LSv54]
MGIAAPWHPCHRAIPSIPGHKKPVKNALFQVLNVVLQAHALHPDLFHWPFRNGAKKVLIFHDKFFLPYALTGALVLWMIEDCIE